MRFTRSLAAFALLALVAGCGRAPPASDTAGGTARSQGSPEQQRLAEVAEQYRARFLQLNPLFASAVGEQGYRADFGDYLSATWMADSLAMEQETLAALEGIDARRLDLQGRRLHEALQHRTRLQIDGYRYPAELLVLEPFADLPGRFSRLGAVGSSQPFANTADYEAFLARMDGFAAWVDQAINNLRLARAKGVLQPRVIVERTLAGLAQVARLAPTETEFWTPIENFPAAVPIADRARLSQAYSERIAGRVLPAYRRFQDFLRDEYLPVARKGVGFAELPGGAAWYAYLVRLNTDSTLTPAAAHELAADEVAKLRTTLVNEQAQPPLAPTPLSPGELWRAWPLHPASGRAAPPQSAPPAPTLPDPTTLRAHAALAALAAAQRASLAGQPGAVSASQLRLALAALAVADTGLHARGWSRDRAIAYLQQTGLMSGEAALLATDRCIAQPAQALTALVALRLPPQAGAAPTWLPLSMIVREAADAPPVSAVTTQ